MNHYIELKKSLVLSPAFKSLSKSGTHVFFRFYVQLAKMKPKKNFVFTYKEARKELKLSNQAFINAIDELVDKGFLVRARLPNGNLHRPVQYALSTAWRKWGTRGFEIIEPRIKDPRKKGRIQNLRRFLG